MRLEVDENGDWLLRLDDATIEDLEWDEGDQIDFEVQNTRSGEKILVAYLK